MQPPSFGRVSNEAKLGPAVSTIFIFMLIFSPSWATTFLIELASSDPGVAGKKPQTSAAGLNQASLALAFFCDLSFLWNDLGRNRGVPPLSEAAHCFSNV